MTDADIRFYFDPVCPFAWITSKWVRMVAAQRDYAVDWRFISLRMINSGIDYDTHFPVGYGADARAVAALTGAFVNQDPVFLQSTGFVLDPAGNVVVSVYSSGAIGRLVPEDVAGLIRYLRARTSAST